MEVADGWPLVELLTAERFQAMSYTNLLFINTHTYKRCKFKYCFKFALSAVYHYPTVYGNTYLMPSVRLRLRSRGGDEK